MTVFRCRRCRTELTRPAREVPLPAPDDHRPPEDTGAGLPLPPRVPAGTYAATESGFVLHPGDVRGLTPIHGRGRRNGCCGMDGLDGPNLACGGCGADVATERNDCWCAWQQVTLVPGAVERREQPWRSNR